MEKNKVENYTKRAQRHQVIVFNEQDFPFISLAGYYPLDLMTFRVQLSRLGKTEFFTIGRDRTCDYVVSPVKDKVSRLHCYISKEGENRYLLHDVSLNGTLHLRHPLKTHRNLVANLRKHLF